MNKLTIFKNEQFGEIRTVIIDNEMWFVGKDVSDILGYQNGSRDINRHVDEEDRRKAMVFDSHQDKETIIINESGLYSLILSSKLPTAKEFKRWVTSEILPSVRKHGAYMTPETIENVLLNPDTIITLAQQLKAERAKVAELQPKADYYDTVAKADGLTSIRETAKLFGIKERQFIKFLESHKYLFRNSMGKLIPYSTYTPNLFEVKEVVYKSTHGENSTTVYTKITPKGREALLTAYRKYMED